MRLSQIRHFLAVVDAGSIRAAARELRLSQPALTKSIRRLEEDLGAVLISRSVRGALPTVYGRAFLARARSVTADLRRAREEVLQMRGAREGSLAVGAAPGPALGLLPQVLSQLRERWGEASIRVMDVAPAEVLPALREGLLDLALSVRIGPLAEVAPDFLSEPLYRNEVVIIARSGHPLAGARRLAELADAEWVRAGWPGSAQVSTLTEMFRSAGLPEPHYRVDSGSFLALPEFVACSDLLAVVPGQIAARDQRAGRIVRVRLREPVPSREISLFRRAHVPLTPIAAECIGILRHAARRIGPAQSSSTIVPSI